MVRVVGLRGVLVAAALTLVGCGPIVAAVTLTQKSSSGGGATNDPPALTVAPMSGSGSGAIDVPFTVADAQSDVVNVVVEFQVPGASFQTASATADAVSLTKLATNQAGRSYTFRWDSKKDVGPKDVAGVLLRFTPFDAQGGAATTTTLDVANNEAPAARILRLTSDRAAGLAFVDYILTDSASHATDLTVEYSLDGGATFRTATRATGAQGQGTQGLATTPTGEIYAFAWDDRADAPGVRSPNVVMRLTPRDTETGATVTQGGLAIDNTSPPRVLSVTATVTGNTVDMAFVVADNESDPVSASLSFSANGGAVQAAANITPLFPDTSLTGLTTTPSGVTHQLRWSAVQLGAGAHAVSATLTASDGTGSAGASTTFSVTISGNGPPTGSLGAIARQVGVAQVTIPLTAQDPDNDAVAVVASFSVGGGPAYTATVLAPTSGLGTPGAYSLVWDAQADLTFRGYTGPVTQGIVFALALNDGTQVGPSLSTNAFTFGNAPPVVESVVQPAASSGVLPLQFALSDSTLDAANVTVEFRFDTEPDTAFRPITVAVGSLTSLATSAGAPGTTHSVGWDTKAAAPGGIGLDNRTVVVRFIPNDGLAGGAGTAVTTAAFLVTNNQPSNATVQTVTRPPVPGATTIPFTIFNAEGAADPITIDVSYSVQGGPFTSVPSARLSSTGPFVGTPGGTSYSITWDAAATAPLGVAPVTTSVVVRVTPVDAVQAGTPGTSAPFAVGNDVPDLQIANFTSSQSGSVPFVFTLTDSSSDPAFLTFQIRVDGTLLANPTLTASPTTPFPTSNTTPLGYTVVWNAPADVPSINNNVISVTITPTDAFGGTPAARTLADFTLVSSNQQPVVTFPVIPRVDTDDVTFGLTVKDLEGSNVRLDGIDVSYTAAGFPPSFASATITSPVLPATVTGTGGAGATQTIAWNARNNLGTSARTFVLLRARFTDLGTGLSFTKDMTPQEAFIYGNDPPEIRNLTVPGGTSSGSVVVTFDAADSTSDTVDLYDLALGGATYKLRWTDHATNVTTTTTAMISEGGTIGLPTSPSGIRQFLVVDTVATIGSRDATCVLLLTPSDKGYAPAPGETGPEIAGASFVVLNNSPPVAVVLEPLANPDRAGPIELAVIVRDAESDPADVVLQWSRSETSFPSISGLTDPQVRQATLLDPDARAPLNIVTPLIRVLAEGQCVVPPACPVDEVVVNGVFPEGAFASPGVIGATVELLAPSGDAVQWRQLVGVLSPTRLRVDAAFSPIPYQGQRLLIRQSPGVLVGRATSPGGIKHRAAWDAPTDLGIGDDATRYFIRATAFFGTRAGPSFTSSAGKPLATRGFSFKPRVSSGSGGGGFGPFHVATGDFNADGLVDFVTADGFGGGSLSVFLASPDGSFVGAQVFAGNSPTWVAVGDFDGDGDLDLVCANAYDDTVTVLRNDGAGTFSSTTTYPTENFPTEVHVADFNGDGKLDLIVRPGGIFLGNGDCTFTFLGVVFTGGSGIGRSLAVEDLDGDGKVDYAVSTGYNVEVKFGNGDGTFTAGPSMGANSVFVLAADTDGDKRLDLVSVDQDANQVSVFQNRGSRTWALVSTVLASPLPQSLVAADFNRDGLLDLVVTLPLADALALFAGNGDGTFSRVNPTTATTTGPWFAAAADFDRDGVPDLVLADGSTDGSRTIFTNMGSVAVEARQTLTTDTYPVAVTVADLDGDGSLDAISNNQQYGSMSVVLGAGDGTFLPGQKLPIRLNPGFGSSGMGRVNVADMNEDGRLDLVVAFRDVIVYFGNGDGTFNSPPLSFVGSDSVNLVLCADLDNDGHIDLVTVQGSPPSVVTYRGSGTGAFAPAGSVPIVGTFVSAIACVDVNEDGKLDLAATSWPPNLLSVFLGNGDGTFQSPQTLAPGAVPLGVVGGDVNGDGHIDLVTADQDGPSFSVFLGDGAGAFTRTSVPAPSLVQSVELRDLNGDQRLDLIGTALSGAAICVALGRGDGTFVAATGFGDAGVVSTGPSPKGAIAADLNGDGLFDLMSADSGASQISVLISRHQGPPSVSLGLGRTPSPSAGDGSGGSVTLAAGPHRIDTSAGTIDGTRSASFKGGAFHLTSFVISTGATVIVEGIRPLVVLAQTNVTIDGSLECLGMDGGATTSITGRNAGSTGGKGGPGASDGGGGGGSSPGTGLSVGLRGEGFGGGHGGVLFPASGGGGGFGSAGAESLVSLTAGGVSYGGPQLDPLHGGSGGGGGSIRDNDASTTVSPGDDGGGGGGGGGGAVRITAGGSITILGTISANGGAGGRGNADFGGHGGGGSGGSILLQARGTITIFATGVLSAVGGVGASGGTAPAGGNGGDGRIRFETPSGTISNSGSVLPASQASNVGVLPP